MHVEVRVSVPYVKIAGGWTGLRPVGKRRTYTAEVNGTTFANENKAEIQAAIRRHCVRNNLPRPTFTYRETETL